MHPVRALALRRLALMSAGLAATLGAHAVATHGMAISRAAPFLWGMLLLGAVMCGGRSRFRTRSYPAIAAIVVGLQTLLHAVLVAAPWALGIGPHHHPLPLIDARSFAIHVVAALVLAVLLRRADLVLALAVAATTAVARILAGPVRPRAGRRRAERVRPHVTPVRSADPHAPRTSRGPPIGHLIPAGAAPTR